MDDERARELLWRNASGSRGCSPGHPGPASMIRDEANARGDMADPAQRLTAEQGDDAVNEGLQARLRAMTAPSFGWPPATTAAPSAAERPSPTSASRPTLLPS